MKYLKFIYEFIGIVLLDIFYCHFIADGWRIYNDTPGDVNYEFYIPNWVLTFLVGFIGYKIGVKLK
jgi:hypothetical protein